MYLFIRIIPPQHLWTLHTYLRLAFPFHLSFALDTAGD